MPTKNQDDDRTFATEGHHQHSELPSCDLTCVAGGQYRPSPSGGPAMWAMSVLDNPRRAYNRVRGWLSDNLSIHLPGGNRQPGDYYVPASQNPQTGEFTRGHFRSGPEPQNR